MRISEFIKIADILAKAHKISVRPGPGWAADIQKRIVFYKEGDLYNLNEEHILGCLLHEIAHIHYTTDYIHPKNDPELHHSTMNMLEDNSIEYLISKDYTNAGEILNTTRTELLDILIRNLPKMEMTKYEKALLYAAIRFNERGFAIAKEEYEKLGNQIAEYMKSKKEEILERKQTKDLVPMANEIVRMMKVKFGQPTENEKQQMRNNNESNGSQNDPVNRQYRNGQMQNAKPGTIKDKIIKQLGGKDAGHNIDNEQRYQLVNEIVDKATEIGKKLRNVIKGNNAMQFTGRYRSGKLSTKKLIKIKTIKDRRPFQRQIVKNNKSYAFAIASDVSGSMDHIPDAEMNKKDAITHFTNADFAVSSMEMVAESLRIAGIPRSIHLFGDRNVTVEKLGKNQIRFEKIADMQNVRKAGSGTEIAEAIKGCAHELEKSGAERKIMIILTDGESDYNEMQKEVKIARNKSIEPLAIVIGNSGHGVEQIFGQNGEIRSNFTRPYFCIC
jgi:hypothetical protein